MTFPTEYGLHILLFYIYIIHTSSAQFHVTYETPRLDCSHEKMRLFIDPIQSFTGHIYVKGFFFSKSCHIDLSRTSTNRSISMEIPFQGDCNVRRHRTSNPLSVTYEATVIIQHHPLFVTAGDRAYRLNCVYKQASTQVKQQLNVNDLAPESVAGDWRPTCRYGLHLGDVAGPPPGMVNVGDDVTHKWSCDSDDHGFLVHSCIVRNDVGGEYKLVDERGCIVDSSLMPDLIYSTNLSVVQTTIRAFQFADQVVVHFSCQLTMCRREKQGCEGIAPPTCHPIDLPPIRTEYKLQEKTAQSTGRPTKSGTKPTTNRPENNNEITDESEATFDDTNNVLNDRTPSTNLVQTTVSDRSHLGTTHSVSQTALRNTTTTQPDEHSESESTVIPMAGSQTVRTGSSKWLDGIQIGNYPDNQYGLEISNLEKQDDSTWPKEWQSDGSENFGIEEISSIFNTKGDELDDLFGNLPYPKTADVYYAKSRPRRNKQSDEKITVEVDSGEFFVLTGNQLSAHETERKTEKVRKSSDDLSKTLIFSVLISLLVFMSCVVIGQQWYYRRKIELLKKHLAL